MGAAKNNLKLLPDCGSPRQGYLPGGNNVPGGEGIWSGGPEDCANKCFHARNCLGWTIYKRYLKIC